jgi:hypothetical protein
VHRAVDFVVVLSEGNTKLCNSCGFLGPAMGMVETTELGNEFGMMQYDWYHRRPNDFGAAFGGGHLISATRWIGELSVWKEARFHLCGLIVVQNGVHFVGQKWNLRSHSATHD